MHELDIYIKRELKVRDYLRYCDDFCLFSNDKIQLREWREKIREFITEKLKLEFSKSEIFPVKNGLDFVGYRHFKDFILLRKRTAKRIKARMLKIHETGRDKKMNTTIMGQIASAHGWMKHACSYNFRKSMCFEKLRNMI
jgi:hypothetical protein